MNVWLDLMPDWAKAAFKRARPLEEELYSASRCLQYVYQRENGGQLTEYAAETSALKGAMIAFWIAKPVPAYYLSVIHAFQDSPNSVQTVALESDPVFVPNLKYHAGKISSDDLDAVRKIHKVIRQTYLDGLNGEDSSLAIAIRFSAKALADTWWQSRYLSLWVCLEALFGSESEVSYRIALRAANFLEQAAPARKELFSVVRQGYKLRSRSTHGRPFGASERDKAGEAMSLAEELLRISLQKILLDDSLLKIFLGPDRETYLDSLAFGRQQLDS